MAFFKGASKDAQRASQLKQQRSKERQEIEFKKKKIESELNVDDGISNIFTARQDIEDSNFAPETVGLVTLEELKAQQEAMISAREKLALAEKCDKNSDRESDNKKDVVQVYAYGDCRYQCRSNGNINLREVQCRSNPTKTKIAIVSMTTR